MPENNNLEKAAMIGSGCTALSQLSTCGCLVIGSLGLLMVLFMGLGFGGLSDAVAWVAFFVVVVGGITGSLFRDKEPPS